MARRQPSRVNLHTSKMADGAAPTRGVYELLGIPTTSFRHKTLAEYSKMVNGLNLIELYEHAFELGVSANPDRGTLIKRLEDHFIQENAKFSRVNEQPDNSINDSLREQAEKIVARGR